MGRRSALSMLAAGTALACLSVLAGGDATGRASSSVPRPTGCPEAHPSAGYVKRVHRVLASRSDTWGRALLRSKSGPTYEGVSRLLPPLLLARAANGKALTDSGVHYTHFSEPSGAKGATSVALHVADGSQIVSRRAHGRRLTVSVGGYGRERYGSCLRRLGLPALAEGYLPILDTSYVDAEGVRYEQESFAIHIRETTSLVSFVRLTADATSLSSGVVRLRFTPSVQGLRSDGVGLWAHGRAYLFFSGGARVAPGSVTYVVPAGTSTTVYVAWLNTPATSAPVVLDEARYERARGRVQRYWDGRLDEGGLVIVPEKRVLDAERNLLVQNLAMTWRYSLGNNYEQLSTPEAVDVARVLVEYGQGAVGRTVLDAALRRRRTHARPLGPSRRRTIWKMGSRLVGIASYVRMTGDVEELARATPTARGYVDHLRRALRSGRHGLLPRERFSSDVAARVYGLHTQAVAWQGLRDMASVWRDAGYTRLANESARTARVLERGLRRAVRRSSRRLPGGALFVPVRLLEREKPFRAVTDSREGSYWNLVMPYALASGLFLPESSQARGVLRYLDTHGARMLGLLRTGAYGIYGRDAQRRSGVNPVYGLNFARFLADNDRADDLVLDLYAQLAVEHAPGTFVSGESVSIAPFGRQLYRTTYLPPNGASNAAFLETLRSLVVHERRSRAGAPVGLDLAFATPRGWLRPGRTVEVRDLATSFGPISYTLAADESGVHATIDVPDRARLRGLWLRFRLPDGKRVARVEVDGAPYRGLLDGDTVRLPTTPGPLEVEAYAR